MPDAAEPVAARRADPASVREAGPGPQDHRTEEDMPMHRTDPRVHAATALLLLACSTCAWAGEGVAGGVLEDEVLATERAPVRLPAAGVAGDAATTAPSAANGRIDLRLPVDAPAGAQPSGASPITYTGLSELLGDADGSTGTFDYTALPQALDDDARWEPESERKDRGIAATVSVAAGTGGMMETSASVTVPLLDDRLTIRVSGATGRGNGYLRDFTRDEPGEGAFGTGTWDRSSPWDGRRRGDDDFSRLGVDLRWAPPSRDRAARP